MLHRITELLTEVVGDYGLYAVFALMLIDAVLPAASELVMVYAGAVAAGAFAGQKVTFAGVEIDAGWPAYLAMALSGTIGYTIGSVGGWAIGLYGGRPFLERRGRWLHLDAEKLDRAERWFDRWGDWAVFLGRITPVVRSFVSIPAGVARAALGRYTVLTLIGSALWCFAFAAAGWAVGANWETFHHRFRYADITVGILLGAAIVALLVRRRRSRPARRAAEDPAR